MVKIGFYLVKKRGKKGFHEYEEVCIRFPKELHEFMRCLRHRQLEIKATREGNITHIMLIEKNKSLNDLPATCSVKADLVFLV